MLIARLGLAPAFALNALGFAGVIASLARLSAHGLPAARAHTSVAEEIGAGIRYALSTPLVTVVLALLTVVSLFVFNFTVYVPLLAGTVLGLGAEGYGFLMAAVGLGAVAGAVAIGVARAPSLATLFTGAGVAVAGLLWLSQVRQFWTAAPALFLTGFSGTAVVAGANTRIQVQAPPELRGRVIGLFVLLSSGLFPIGAFVVGAISQRSSVSIAFLCGGIGGVLSLAAIGAAWRLRRRP
jgi:predicted MFS family arabinose efflux permease